MFDLYSLDPLNSGSSGAAALGSYKTSDSFSDTLQAGYFNEGSTNLKGTQAILVKAADKTGILLISVSGGIVTAEEFGGGSGDAVQWDDIEDKPAVIAAGDDAAAARLAIGAGTSNLAIGNTATTAMKGDTPIPAAYTNAMAQAAIKGKPSIAALTAESTLEDVIAALQA